MHNIAKTLIVMIGALTFAASSASAAIVCNEEGDCWHLKGEARYKPELRLHVHPDNWKFAEKDRYRWREHEGHGYWRSGVWIGID